MNAEVDELLAGGLFLEVPKEISVLFRRMTVLVDLYHLSLVPKVVKFSEMATEVMNTKNASYKNEQGVAVKIKTPQLEQAERNYYDSYRKLQETLYHIIHDNINID